MIIAELITALEKYDPTLTVIVKHNRFGEVEYDTVSSIEEGVTSIWSNWKVPDRETIYDEAAGIEPEIINAVYLSA